MNVHIRLPTVIFHAITVGRPRQLAELVTSILTGVTSEKLQHVHGLLFYLSVSMETAVPNQDSQLQESDRIKFYVRSSMI